MLLAKKLESHVMLNEPEIRALKSLPVQTRSLPPREEVPASGDTVRVIEDGMACRFSHLADGRRQILGFLVPGDVLDLRRFVFDGPPAHPVTALSPLKLGAIPTEALLSAIEAYPKLTRALWSATLAEESICQEWLVSVGQRSAIERMAHLLCELAVRISAVGRAMGPSYPLPVTQTELADTLGLSTVHVNRTLQKLRQNGLISLQSGVVSILDFKKLANLGLFSPGYLCLRHLPDFAS